MGRVWLVAEAGPNRLQVPQVQAASVFLCTEPYACSGRSLWSISQWCLYLSGHRVAEGAGSECGGRSCAVGTDATGEMPPLSPTSFQIGPEVCFLLRVI